MHPEGVSYNFSFLFNAFVVLHKNQKVIISVMRNEDPEYVKDKEAGNGDSSDMVFEGYEITNNYDFFWDTHFDYDEIEYFTGELKGFDRVLKTVSNLLTNEIEFDLFLDAYNYLKAEDIVEKEKVNFCLYTPEALQLAGVNPRKSIKSASSVYSFN